MIPMCVLHSITPASLRFQTCVSHNFTSLYSSTGVEQVRLSYSYHLIRYMGPYCGHFQLHVLCFIFESNWGSLL
jgi:hypothetical protein